MWMVVSLLLGQVVEPPIAGQPGNFSQLVGVPRFTARAEPTQVRVEEPILLTVNVSGAFQSAYAPDRSKLRIFTDNLRDAFYLEFVSEQADVAMGQWTFQYRLRPKSVEVTSIPTLRLVYFHPGRRNYQTALAPSMPIEVLPAVAPVKPSETNVKKYIGPETIDDYTPARSWLSGFSVPTMLVGLVIGLAVVWVSRRQSADPISPTPTADALEMIDTDKPELVMQTVLAYLQTRLGVRFVEATPSEVRDALRRRGFSKQVQEEAAAWFRQVDALRFAPGQDASMHLGESAKRWIRQVEADPAMARVALNPVA